MFMKQLITAISCVASALLLSCGGASLEPVAASNYPVVAISSVVYNEVTQKNVVSWNLAANGTQVDLLKIYRSSVLNPDGQPVDFSAADDRGRVSPGSSTFSDVVGLDNKTYYYYMRAVQISYDIAVRYDTAAGGTITALYDTLFIDTLEGVSSDTDQSRLVSVQKWPFPAEDVINV